MTAGPTRWRTPLYVGAALAGWMAIHELLKVYWCRVAHQRLKSVISPPELVRSTTAAVMASAEHVEVSAVAINRLVGALTPGDLERMMSPAAFDRSIHFVDGTWRTVQYLLLVDALNFCFWPKRGLEYEHLAMGVKDVIQRDGIAAISAARLATATVADVRGFFGSSDPVPLEQERMRVVQEVGKMLLARFRGSAAALVRAAHGSAAELVRLVTKNFPAFRDHAVYRGRQVFFYKRAQIFAGDVYGAFGGRGLGRFHDIDALTMFADYRVPVVLRGLSVLRYSQRLADQVAAERLVAAGSAEEIEIRAATVQAVEAIRRRIRSVHGDALTPTALQLDWWLWDAGERARLEAPPHHRTETIYY